MVYKKVGLKLTDFPPWDLLKSEMAEIMLCYVVLAHLGQGSFQKDKIGLYPIKKLIKNF